MVHRIDVRTRALFGTALATLLTLAAPARAQEQAGGTAQGQPASGGLNEIIVTAQRRAENLQEVPIAIAR